jgi:hypothetical protein
MQSVLQHPTSVDELGAVANRAQQCLEDLRLGRPTGTLPNQPDECRAVTVVSLEAPRA